jgi:hypothetical protein
MRKYLPSASLCLLSTVAILWLANSGVFQTRVAQANAQKSDRDDALREVKSDVAQLKDKAGDQAHAMVSVAYHFNNLWFAADAENWPLAEFYWNETRSHLRWAVRIIPVRKDNAGQEVKLQNILEAFESSPLKQLREAIDSKDREKFVSAYRFAVETCYACHKASDKPYLRPRIPEQPAEPAINFDPQAKWPL